MLRFHGHGSASLGTGAVLVLLILVAGCAEGPPGWKTGIEDHRARVDALFAGPESPLAPGDRAGFTGLEYYPPDPSWRFETVPDRSGAGRPAEMLDTKGNPRRYTVEGRLMLRRDGDTLALTLYRSPDGSLFLPFRDATSGGETYSGGRYLDVSADREGLLVVDFNRAYNPYCAYDERWACPIVPEENTLSVAVTAGEKGYHH